MYVKNITDGWKSMYQIKTGSEACFLTCSHCKEKTRISLQEHPISDCMYKSESTKTLNKCLFRRRVVYWVGRMNTSQRDTRGHRKN